MTVRLFYVDESYDDNKFCLSAIGIRHSDWHECFSRIRQHRALLKQDFGIFLRKEIHAHEFVSGRGRISEQIIGKHQRSRIFDQLLSSVAQFPNVMLINICLDVKGRKDPQLDAWDRLTNRIERTMLEFEKREIPLRRDLVAKLPTDYADRYQVEVRLNSYRPRAIIFADEGREPEITKVMRKMSVFNPIPSQFGEWKAGKATQNIPIERVIEDPIFKKSHQSFFLQLADCVAFALLKREVVGTQNIKKYGINKMFEHRLSGICYKKASPKDPLGIVRK